MRKCHFLDLTGENRFFVTTLEEDGFSPLELKLRSREEDGALNSKEKEEEDVDSIKQMMYSISI
jgi:hypothetical protein